MTPLPIHRTLVIILALGAVALAAEVPGVGNFHQINERLYRGAQPTSEGFQSLAKLGIKTVIDLRERDSRSDAEKLVVEKDGMRYVNIPFAGLSAPSDEQVAQVLSLFADPASGPVFIHCLRGADRTGTVVACYRVIHDHWKNQDALAEARSNGMSWLERGMQHYVLSYQAPVAASAIAAAPANL
jgi:tyrosine-protein phosphatase SIW14